MLETDDQTVREREETIQRYRFQEAVQVALLWGSVLIGSAVMLVSGTLAAIQWEAMDIVTDDPVLGALNISLPWETYAQAIAYTVAAVIGFITPPVVVTRLSHALPRRPGAFATIFFLAMLAGTLIVIIGIRT